VSNFVRVCLWVPVSLDIPKDADELTEEDVREAFIDAYGNENRVEIDLTIWPDWDIIDSWSEE